MQQGLAPVLEQHRARGRGRRPRPRRRGLLPLGDAEHAGGGARRAGAAGLRPAPGPAPHHLGGHDLPGRRVSRSRRPQDHPSSPSPTASCGCPRRVERNSVVRKLQVMKMRGQGDLPGPAHRSASPTTASRSSRASPSRRRSRRRPTRQQPGADDRAPVDRRERPRRDAGRRHPARVLRPGRRPLRLGQDRAGHPVHRRRGQARGARGHRDLREASRRLSADHLARAATSTG